MKVFPKFIEGNGLMPLFSNKKKWDITCGNCSHGYSDKVLIQESCSSICPCCHTQNVWSLSRFLNKYEKSLEEAFKSAREN